MKKETGTEYSVDYCNINCSDIVELVSHITPQHKTCTVCDYKIPSEFVFETHTKAVNKIGKSKHWMRENHRAVVNFTFFVCELIPYFKGIIKI